MLEFRAGKMVLEGKRVMPDIRKGLVRVVRGEEGLAHFQWIDRTLDHVEDDQIVFPDEAVFEKVNQASGRVYILKFNTDDRKFFFWMQEPNADGDEHLCESVNFYINQAIEFIADEEPDVSAPVQESEHIVGNDFISRSQNSVCQSVNSDVTVASDINSSGPVKLVDLQRILSSIGSTVTENPEYADEGLGLADILKPDLILPLVDTLSLESRLVSYLPEGEWSSNDFIDLLQSPPFRQQVDSFTYVLRTGQVDLSQFEIDPSNYKLGVLSFLEALEDSVSKNSKSENSCEDDEKIVRSQSCNGDDPMDEN